MKFLVSIHRWMNQWRLSQLKSAIKSTPSSPTPSPLEIIVDEIASAASRGGKIFVHGVGREGLMMKALCMRLAHLGLFAHCVGDMTTPPICSSDLLIASAGPGSFSTVDAICGVAKSKGGRVLVITAQPELVKYGCVVAHVAAQTMADDGGGAVEEGGGELMLLPMGSVYEGALFVLFEMVVFKLASILGQNPLNKSDLATLICSSKL